MENNDQQIKYESASDEFLSGSLSYLDDVKDAKVAKRRRSLKPIMIVVLVIVGLFGGVAAMLSTSKRPAEETAMEDSGNEVSDVQVQLNSCLRAAQADIEVGDPEFYPKLIASYKAQITCYDRYDNESLAKKDLEDKLTSVEVAARDAGINQAAIDAEYDRRAAQIDEEYRSQMAALDAEAARQDAETQRRLAQSDAEWAKQKAEQEARQAQYEAQQRAREEAEAKAKQEKVAQCNAYRAQYGTRTPQELAEDDPEVRNLYDTWQYYIGRNKDKAYTAYSSYRLKLQEKIGYYANLGLACD